MADVTFHYANDGNVPVSATTGGVVFVEGNENGTHKHNVIVVKTSAGNKVFGHEGTALEWSGNI